MTNSIWLSYSDETSFKTLNENISVDVAIIGGGITGITAAELLSQQGFKVAVLESYKVGVSSSGNSTGNLYQAVGEILLNVPKKFNDEVSQKVIESRALAIDLIEENVRKYSLDCDFRRIPWHFFSTLPEAEDKINKSLEVAKRLELEVSTEVDTIPFKVKSGFKLENSAQFNPLRYVQGLAKAIDNPRCLIFENSKVEKIKSTLKENILETANGSQIKSKFLFHATHTPKGISLYHAEMSANREYGIACKIKGSFPEGAFFGYFNSLNITSTRMYERNGEQFLIVVGEPHPVGHGESLHHLEKLEKFARDHFEVLEVTHRWGAQNYKPADEIPYIGKKTIGTNVYVATGFSSHGLTYGTVGAQVVSDLIGGKENKFAEMYRPTRFNPFKAAPKFIKENVNVSTHLLKDYLLKDKKHLADASPGEGKVVEHEGHKLAVYKDFNEETHICSAVCPHMGCVVHWNNAETSWDCPCHGSRFSTSGEVLEGPALKALASLTELTKGNPILDKKDNTIDSQMND